MTANTLAPQDDLLDLIGVALPLLERAEKYSEALHDSHEAGGILEKLPVLGSLFAMIPGFLSIEEQGRLATFQYAQLALQHVRDELISGGNAQNIKQAATEVGTRLKAAAEQIKGWDTRTSPGFATRATNKVLSPDEADAKFGMRVSWAQSAGVRLASFISRCNALS
jgi:hypothetical protein